MRSIGMLHAHAGVGFQAGMRFQATAFSAPLRSHTSLPRGVSASSPEETTTSTSTSTSTPIRRSRRRQSSCRMFSSLFDSVDGPSRGDEEKKADGLPEGAPSSSDDEDGSAAAIDGIGDGAAVDPEPRADDLADSAAAGTADPSVAEGAAAAPAGEEEQIDWDKAWASTRQRMEQEKKAAPAFTGRKQVVASKNAEGGYDFEEISADGSSRMRGAKGSGGFGFADSNQGREDGPGRVRRQEQEAVNLATTNQAFAGLFALLLASLIFEIYVYTSGGITNGSTRFQGIGQPTTYDALPLPATPPPEDDLTV